MSKKPAPRPTDAEIEKRIATVSQEILSGSTRKDILPLGKQWGVCNRQIEEYIARATAEIREINKVTLEDTLASIVTNYWDLFRKARFENNLREAHAILNSIAKLKGLEEIKITHKVIHELDSLSDEDLDDALDDIFNREH